MKRLPIACWVSALAICLALAPLTRAQTSRPTATPPQAPSKLEVLSALPGQDQVDKEASPLLGEKWENAKAGLRFNPPKGLREVRTGLGESELVAFVSDDKDWMLKVAESKWPYPLPLTTYRDSMGNERPGILQQILTQVKQTNPGAEVLRNDIVDLAEAKVGLITVRFTTGTARKLTQLAILQTSSNTLYYIFNLTTPGAKADQPAGAEDPDERQAVETLQALLDSVKFLDREDIRNQQNQRLFRTRLLYANWSVAKVRRVLVDEQWLRLIKNGRDIGYTYVVEKPDTRGGSDGVLIGIRSRTVSAPEVTLDAESWMYANADRTHESWTTVARSQDNQGNKNFLTEVGASDQLFERYPFTLKTLTRKGNLDPIERDLPPFYLPQAMGHLLPRLLPLREAKPNQPVQFMFASYVAEQREVMARYVDVLFEQDVLFHGEKIRAVPILDRIGWEGPITTHYVSPEGRYLGSESTVKEPASGQQDPKPVHITILPTDAATLNRLWVKPDLTAPPRQPDEPQPRPRSGLNAATRPGPRSDRVEDRISDPDLKKLLQEHDRQREEKLRQGTPPGR